MWPLSSSGRTSRKKLPMVKKNSFQTECYIIPNGPNWCRKLNASESPSRLQQDGGPTRLQQDGGTLEGRGSLSTLNVSDDDLSGLTSPSGRDVLSDP